MPHSSPTFTLTNQKLSKPTNNFFMIDLEIFHKIQSQIKNIISNFRMTSESEKICILLKSVGNAPVLKKDKFMLGKTTKLRHVFKIFVRIKWGASFRWSIGPSSAWGSIEAMTIEKSIPSMRV